MGWDRVILKQRAKEAFRRNYGICVLVALVCSLLEGPNFVQIRMELEEIGISIPGGIVITASLVAIILGIFIFPVWQVGVYRFFVENRDYNAPASKMFFGFSCGHYGNVVLTMFLMGLKIFLWSLLLFIPGIIKAYEYRMVPYILAEQPDINQEQAFAISRDMMMGNKMDAFILDLSFFGWIILAAFTCGLAGIFWVEPYIQATEAELYAALRDNWMQRYGQSGMDMAGENF